MSKKRRDANASKTTPSNRRPATAPQPSLAYRFRRFSTPYLLATLAAFLMSLAFPPFEFSWVAYLALVPLLVMALATRSPRAVFRAAWVGGIVFFGINARWVIPISYIGWVAAVVYLGVYWALFAWLLRRLHDRAPRWPLTLTVPVLWVGLEWFRGWCLTGFPWLFLGHTQYENLTLIQTADLVGVYGTSFLVAMTAGLVADLLARPLVVPAAASSGGRARPNVAVLGLIGLTAVVWAATVGYGTWRLGQKTTRPGPTVVTVQTSIPQLVKQEARRGNADPAREMLDTQVRLTYQGASELAAAAAGARPARVVWPETMVPGIMNRAFLEDDLAGKIENEDLLGRYRFVQDRSRGYWLELALLSREIDAPILFGATTSEARGVVRLPGGRYMVDGPRWNSALLVTPACKPYAVAHVYSKVHLVPFGEWVPFKKSWPWLREQLMALSPYDFDYTVEPGMPDQAPFEIVCHASGTEPAQTLRFQVAICYEDSMAYRVREMARPTAPGGPKAIDFLVNISNDGWFCGSDELDQHLNLCVFRAVENRLPIVRSVNSGISAIIRPDGRIEKVVADAAGRRRDVEGETYGRLTLDSRLAPYTGLGDKFAGTCVVLSAAALGWVIVSGWRKKKAEGKAGGA